MTLPRLIFFACVLLGPGLASAAVSVESTGTPNVASGASPLTLSGLTVGTGSDRCLVVGAYINLVGPTSVSLTWNGVSFPAAEITYTTVPTMYVFTLVNPASGNNSLVLTWSGGASAVMTAVEFAGANQTTCAVAADDATATGTSTTSSVTITSAAGDATVAFAGNTAAYYTAQTQTLIANTNSGSIAFDATYALGGSSNTHDFTVPSATWGAVGVHILAASSTSATRNLLLMGVGQ